ncbi:FadR/GntR family transcriptional regulator [Ornithinimicrobium sp. INDO-MA30-4]|uniref:FadR/GntR family transcriptional regulator n=1 Tax=Ornithinimicrobium sp. INDO-MA30-4 TaxID=2908651 RepID=UPI001F421541|nr:FCD domain-containing protein [Ornithinimicrobium sp. INDO-MA30-4]UJH71512.1 FCD domain-containing protein [Ornithinimicrobium sp. INDO-MA30-4]
MQSLHASARELIDRRLVQETGLIHLALDHLNDESLESLDALVREMDEASGWAQFHTLDVRFHRAIASMAHAPAALDDYFSVTDALYAFYLPYPMSYLFTSNDEHRALAAAMRAGDRPQCHHLAARHVAVLHQTMFFGLTDATGAED